MFSLFQFTIDLRSRTNEIAPVDNFETALQGYLQAFLFIAALGTFFYMLWGAFDWIMAGGESGKIESARKKITQAVIGLTVLASVGVIFLIVQSFLGVSILNGGAGGGRVGDGSCSPGCPANTVCQNSVCVLDPN